MAPKLVHCTPERHALAIVHTTALYDYQPRTAEQMQPWFAAKQQGGHPVLGLEDEVDG